MARNQRSRAPSVEIPEPKGSSSPPAKEKRIHPLVKLGGYLGIGWLGATNVLMMLGQLAEVDSIYPGIATVAKTLSVVAIIIAAACWMIADTTRQ